MYKFAARAFLSVACLALMCAIAAIWGASPVYASFTYPHYDVDITVNRDSTVDVTETLTYDFLGTYHGVVRDILLEDAAKIRYCQQSGSTCGGFERLALIGVYDEAGKTVDPSQYQAGETSDSDTEQRFYSIKWTVWPSGKTFSGNQEFTWSVKYRLYGSLGWFGDNAYLYWNALPDNREGSVDQAKITVHLPPDIDADEADLDVYTDYYTNYDSSTAGNDLLISTGRLGASGNFTISYKLPVGSVQLPAHLRYTSTVPLYGTELVLDGVSLGNIRGSLDNFPPGNHQLEFKFPGYTSKLTTVNLKPDESISIDASLSPNPVMWVVIVIDLILNGSALIIFPLGAFLIYRQWQNKGQDEDKVPTVIPLFHPPEGVPPYLLGSLKDERVDTQDVTGSIIDLAYRGYIKITEVTQGSNYILTKLAGNTSDKGLNSIEQELMDDIFDTKDSVQTATMGNKFARKYPILVNHIYDELVGDGYFTSSPKSTRTKYTVAGVGVIILGSFIGLILGIGAVFLIGLPGPLLLGGALLVLGVIMVIVANYMPAKTAKGSKIYNQILGFRMYLYTAERYRLQGLKPEEFEKYLSYAIVLNIEKQWAEKFKDIYKGKPDWYEGHDNIVWDAYWVSRFTRSFSNAMVTRSFTSASSGKGSGWSGGGSFGGFSGGGGGGGHSGAF